MRTRALYNKYMYIYRDMCNTGERVRALLQYLYMRVYIYILQSHKFGSLSRASETRRETEARNMAISIYVYSERVSMRRGIPRRANVQVPRITCGWSSAPSYAGARIVLYCLMSLCFDSDACNIRPRAILLTISS